MLHLQMTTCDVYICDPPREKRRQSVALRNRAPVTPAITFSTTVPIAKDIHAYNFL